MAQFATAHTHASACAHRHAAAQPAFGAAASAASGGSPCGAGWYESSWDLLRGLEVREGLPGDMTANEWLEHCLRR